MSGRTHCPSCRHRLSPYAVECPVCGLGLSRPPLPRPLLFQASAIQHRPKEPHQPQTQALSVPALGRITPVPVATPSFSEETLPTYTEDSSSKPTQVPLWQDAPPFEVSFWPLVKLEAGEFLLLALLNLLIMGLSAAFLKASPLRIYEQAWGLMLPVHFAISWAFLMLPLALAGQSPLMGRLGLLVEAPQPERRLTFSLFHLVSVLFFPISFLCLLLTPSHRTLAEILSGQEILSRPTARMR